MSDVPENERRHRDFTEEYATNVANVCLRGAPDEPQEVIQDRLENIAAGAFGEHLPKYQVPREGEAPYEPETAVRIVRIIVDGISYLFIVLLGPQIMKNGKVVAKDGIDFFAFDENGKRVRFNDGNEIGAEKPEPKAKKKATKKAAKKE